eukprot:4832368-Lingulodinium_polyedra.AAC.1
MSKAAEDEEIYRAIEESITAKFKEACGKRDADAVLMEQRVAAPAIAASNTNLREPVQLEEKLVQEPKELQALTRAEEQESRALQEQPEVVVLSVEQVEEQAEVPVQGQVQAAETFAQEDAEAE